MQTQVNADKNLGLAVTNRETEQRVLRSFDAEIAVRVMGEPMPLAPIGCPHFRNTLSPLKAWHHHVRDFDHSDGECMWEPEPFSTSIEAAMRVVEKMRERGFRWNAQTPPLDRSYEPLSYDICPQCFIEYGYEDFIGLEDWQTRREAALAERHAELRQQWIDAGRPTGTDSWVKPRKPQHV